MVLMAALVRYRCELYVILHDFTTAYLAIKIRKLEEQAAKFLQFEIFVIRTFLRFHREFELDSVNCIISYASHEVLPVGSVENISNCLHDISCLFSN